MPLLKVLQLFSRQREYAHFSPSLRKGFDGSLGKTGCRGWGGGEGRYIAKGGEEGENI